MNRKHQSFLCLLHCWNIFSQKNLTASHKQWNILISENHNVTLRFCITQEEIFLAQKQTWKIKALFSVWKAITVCKSPDPNLANKMFDTLIKPILLYNHEIWGAEVPTALQRRIMNNPCTVYTIWQNSQANWCIASWTTTP